ncbi:TetR/AcrR family transcriptional regulator [Amycolatopsis sp. CA-230715]|uniref:TetR/AcrR family transcriptional regulator n=1 Tax=Amycolatopsis sp. CA-230715 TaxID=2745196 RepID=UPI001C028003|nr:TetR/AcrR family transcriptional regulator [Amycolatopsis sp. CA-230715]QWF82156.1 putative HTH-type transcriptional regulator YfiR [Amycolatopsis sp. CA-230715]
MRKVDPAKHAAKRQAILDAAAGCFAVKGFEKTTTADLCRAAGISSGSLFHYFPTKRAVFSAIFAEDGERTAGYLGEALDAEDPLAALFAAVDHLTAEMTEPVVVQLVLEVAAQAARDDEFAALIRRNEAATRDGLQALVQRTADAGLTDPSIPPRSAANWILALVDALLSRANMDPDLDVAAERATLKLILTRFLRPEPAAGR